MFAMLTVWKFSSWNIMLVLHMILIVLPFEVRHAWYSKWHVFTPTCLWSLMTLYWLQLWFGTHLILLWPNWPKWIWWIMRKQQIRWSHFDHGRRLFVSIISACQWPRFTACIEWWGHIGYKSESHQWCSQRWDWCYFCNNQAQLVNPAQPCT